MNVHTRKLLDQLEIFSLVQTVNLPTHINGHILDLVIVNEPSPVHSTQVNYDLASDHFSILCSLALQKPKQSAKVVSTRSLNKIDHKKFSSDVSDFITPTMSLADLNTNLSATLDKHAPVRGLKVRDRKPTPWYGAISDQLPALKRERRRAERQWRASSLTVHKQMYDAAKQKVVELVNSAKTSFYWSLVSGSKTCKQLFHTMSTLLGKSKQMSFPTVSDTKTS